MPERKRRTSREPMNNKILVINTGSSSIKYQLFLTTDWAVCASGGISRIGESQADYQHRWADRTGRPQVLNETLQVPDHRTGLEHIMHALTHKGGLDQVAELSAIGHRVVHGGEDFSAPCLINERVIQAITAMTPLAPLHNPVNLAGIQVSRALFPSVPQVAVFDTSFHQSMPPQAYRYAIPEALYRKHRIRRYGFHGSSHQYVSRRAAALLGRPPEQTRLITLHLGNGASAAAICDGLCIDTSMGMTPLEGLIMGTRSGDIDPAIHFYLCRELGYSVDDVDRLLNKESGLLGLAGVNDMREIHQRAEAGDSDAQLARELFARRIRKYLGAYYVELGRLDALVFTGGIGEHDAWMRRRVCANLENLGIHMDRDHPDTGAERDISAPDSRVRILVIPTNEELEIARQSWQTVQA